MSAASTSDNPRAILRYLVASGHRAWMPNPPRWRGSTVAVVQDPALLSLHHRFLVLVPRVESRRSPGVEPTAFVVMSPEEFCTRLVPALRWQSHGLPVEGAVALLFDVRAHADDVLPSCGHDGEQEEVEQRVDVGAEQQPVFRRRMVRTGRERPRGSSAPG